MIARRDMVRDADVVIVGAGAAGLSAALGLADRRVHLLAKGPLDLTGNSPMAQGGVAAAVGPGDTPAQHAKDTLAVGGAVGHPDAVSRLTAEGPARLAELIALGARFDRDRSGELDLAREAAHSHHRVLHAKDATGAEIVRALRDGVARAAGVEVFERAVAVDLAVSGGRVVGVFVRHADGSLVCHRTSAVVLATGGIGQVYSRTTNPSEATGDGLALAWRAGARLADVEYVQFHPTALDVGADPMPLLTEALRGAGARLVDEDGQPLFDSPDGELQARDVVARRIWAALRQGKRPLLDAREAVGESFPERFPTVFEACGVHGLDPRLEAIPVAPAAHYHMGGVLVDLKGRTSLDGLWAAGEVACTGVHGANRLASNSLLEALVYGSRAARSVEAALTSGPRQTGPVDVELPRGGEQESSPETDELRARLRQLMWDGVGLVRSRLGLERALDGINAVEERLPEGSGELRNLLTVAGLVARGALVRRESRGAHFRSDHPTTRDRWRRRLVLSRRGAELQVGVEPLPAQLRATEEVSA